LHRARRHRCGARHQPAEPLQRAESHQGRLREDQLTASSMGHPAIDNRTPLAFEPLFTADLEGSPVVLGVVKATYAISVAGRLALAEQQLPVSLAGERHAGGESWKYEPETALTKAATDVALVGSAIPPRGRARELEVALRVGPVEQRAVVVGDRVWRKRLGGGIVATDPEPFERMPLTWERAFGGWDRSVADPAVHRVEPRTPLGPGYRRGRGSFEDGVRLPNVESPAHRVRGFDDHPPPVGFGFTSPNFHPRPTLAGTYDDPWRATRMPLLPRDFDSRFFNGAAPGLTAPGYLRGDEPVRVANVGPAGELAFHLPRVPAPRVTVVKGDGAYPPQPRLDPASRHADDPRLLLLCRGV